MSRRMLMSAIGATALATGLALAAPANASTAWSVSIAGPGYAVSAGVPVYYGHRHWHRAYVAPVVYPAPVVYEAPVLYPAPVVVYRAPRVVYRAPVVVRHW